MYYCYDLLDRYSNLWVTEADRTPVPRPPVAILNKYLNTSKATKCATGNKMHYTQEMRYTQA